MSNEIVRVVDSETPSFVFIRDNDSTHYFYWPKEITLPDIIKQDLEPVKVKNHFGISRYHYHGITVWISPQTDTGKPIVRFSGNFHTPSFLRNNGTKVKGFRIRFQSDVREGDPNFYFLWSRYQKFKFAKENMQFSNKEPYSELMAKEIGTPLKKISYLFDSNYIKNFGLELIVIGEESEITKLVDDIKQRSGSNELTADAISDFFGFS